MIEKIAMESPTCLSHKKQQNHKAPEIEKKNPISWLMLWCWGLKGNEAEQGSKCNEKCGSRKTSAPLLSSTQVEIKSSKAKCQENISKVIFSRTCSLHILQLQVITHSGFNFHHFVEWKRFKPMNEHPQYKVYWYLPIWRGLSLKGGGVEGCRVEKGRRDVSLCLNGVFSVFILSSSIGAVSWI